MVSSSMRLLADVTTQEGQHMSLEEFLDRREQLALQRAAIFAQQDMEQSRVTWEYRWRLAELSILAATGAAALASLVQARAPEIVRFFIWSAFPFLLSCSLSVLSMLVIRIYHHIGRGRPRPLSYIYVIALRWVPWVDLIIAPVFLLGVGLAALAIWRLSS